ncbi:homoserine dehydrogenase [Salarchaeum sp. III]|uniref:homoserine dehydrogenase n=1 Tax=Salarchaeum sp. III TaxID=3107927 RepID=UPI002ED89724
MRLCILGAGAVGASTARLASEYGHTVTAFADSTGAAVDPEGIGVQGALAHKERVGSVGESDPADALAAEYDVLVEATPTTLGDAHPGFEHLEVAFERDKHVVLANKGPVAERYDDVIALAESSAGELRFEATVAGTIPVLSTIEGVGAERVNAVRGVLNGTANFVLSRMSADGLGYEHVLAEAQDLGVAEADPTFDVDGTDAALKGAILANVIHGGGYSLDDVDVEGIEDFPGSALEVAAEDGRTVRLVGEVTNAGNIRVGPRLVPENDPLAVTGTENIVQLDTEHAGRLNLSGAGAGGPETATAVLADITRLN